MKKLSVINENVLTDIIDRSRTGNMRKEEVLKYHPHTQDELIDVISSEMDKQKSNVLDLKMIDVSNITDMDNLFSTFIRLNDYIDTIDVTGWDTHNVTDMRGMFHWNKRLITILGLETWDVENVKDMTFIFANCWNLKYIKLDTWILNDEIDDGVVDNYMFLCSQYIKHKKKGNKLIKC